MGSESGLSRNVLTLLSGTAVALAIPLLLSPFVSRIYSPQMFGQLGVFLAVISIGAVAATGRYELAVLIPKSNTKAIAVAMVAIVAAVSVSCLSLVCIALVSYLSPTLISPGLLPLSVWVVCVPAGILLIATLQTLTYWQSRRQGFGVIANARAAQAIGMTGGQLAAGAAASSVLGLVGGHIVGLLVGILVLARAGWNEFKGAVSNLNRRSLLAAARRYSSMPKFLVAGHLANVVSSQLPVILLTTLYGPHVAGLYAFVEKMVVVPCAVIANSIGEVYRQAAAQTFHEKGNCKELFLKTKRQLIALGSAFALAIWVALPALFPLVFGDAWHEVGRLSLSIGILVFFQTVSSPLSQTVYLASMHRIDLVWQVMRLALSSIAMLLGSVIYADFSASVLLHAVAFALTYGIHSILQWRAARGALKN
jgi:O-antigen/teichoic acid export membrane protein